MIEKSEIRERIEELLRRSKQLQVEAELNERAAALLSAVISGQFSGTDGWKRARSLRIASRHGTRLGQPRHRPRQ